MTDHDLPAEEADFVPWSQLVGEDGPNVPRLIYVAAAAVLALAVGIMLAPRVFSAPSDAGVFSEATEPESIAQSVPAEVDSVELERAPAAPVAGPPIPAELSGDLSEGGLSEIGGPSQRVLAVAEIFVHDYFTHDGDSNRQEDLASWGIETKASAEPEELRVYVEWARSVAADASGDDWDVEVAFRTISSDSDQFKRDPIRVVSVLLSVDGEVMSLPRIDDSKVTTVLPNAPLFEAPPEIAADALEIAQEWGELSVEGALETPEGWDVLVRTGGGAVIRVPVG